MEIIIYITNIIASYKLGKICMASDRIEEY